MSYYLTSLYLLCRRAAVFGSPSGRVVSRGPWRHHLQSDEANAKGLSASEALFGGAAFKVASGSIMIRGDVGGPHFTVEPGQFSP